MRSISLFGAISIGIGGMVGGGIFAVLGEAVSLAHGATALSFFIAGIVAILTTYSYAKLSLSYQNEGGTVVFIDKAFGDNILSGSINLMLWLSYLVTISLYSTAFASYAMALLHHNSVILKHILISVAIVTPAIINILSTSFMEKSEVIVVFIKLTLLVMIIYVATPYIQTDRLAIQNWNSPLSIATAGMIIFVAYEGFELIANSAQEIKNPTKNIPIAFYSSVLIVIAVAVLA